MNKHSRDELIVLSKLYLRCDKHEDMINCIKSIIDLDPHLTDEEQRILYEAYKFFITKKRKSLVKLLEIKRNEKKRKSTHLSYIEELITPAIKSIVDISIDFDALIDKLIPIARTNNEQVYYYRLKCDFIRYRCEFLKDKEQKTAIDLFFETYDKALKLSEKYLNNSCLHHLELMLCFCVFNYEILRKKEEAMTKAREVIHSVDNSEELTDDGKLIIELLRLNVITWSAKCSQDVVI